MWDEYSEKTWAEILSVVDFLQDDESEVSIISIKIDGFILVKSLDLCPKILNDDVVIKNIYNTVVI